MISDECIRALFEVAMKDLGVIAATESVLKNNGLELNDRTIDLDQVKKSLITQRPFYDDIYDNIGK